MINTLFLHGFPMRDSASRTIQVSDVQLKLIDECKSDNRFVGPTEGDRDHCEWLYVLCKALCSMSSLQQINHCFIMFCHTVFTCNRLGLTFIFLLLQPAVYFMVRNRHRDKYLTVTGKLSDTRATFVSISSRNGQSSQIWYFTRGFLKSKVNIVTLHILKRHEKQTAAISLYYYLQLQIQRTFFRYFVILLWSNAFITSDECPERNLKLDSCLHHCTKQSETKYIFVQPDS